MHMGRAPLLSSTGIGVIVTTKHETTIVERVYSSSTTPYQRLRKVLSLLPKHLVRGLPPRHFNHPPLRLLPGGRLFRASVGRPLHRVSLFSSSGGLRFNLVGARSSCGRGGRQGSLGGRKRGSMQAKAAPTAEYACPVSVSTKASYLDGKNKRSRDRCYETKCLHACLYLLGEGAM